MQQSTEMAHEIRMPRLSDSMVEAVVARWLKAPGESVERGEPLVEIETDKATVVYEAEAAGVVTALLVNEGATARLGAPIARLVTGPTRPPEVLTAEAAFRHASGAPALATRVASEPTRPRATPVARRTAIVLGVSLAGVSGTGPDGRIVRADVEALATAGREEASSRTPADAGTHKRELTRLQRVIAERVSEAHKSIPDFTVTADIDMSALLELRRGLSDIEEAAVVSLNDLIIKASAVALRRCPQLNSIFVDDSVQEIEAINIGVVVAADGAIYTPVVKNADRRNILEIARETKRLQERARAHHLELDEISDGSFTISNLGMYGVSSFSAVIYPPQVAIMAVGAVIDRFAVSDSGQPVGQPAMTVSLTCDHRVVYGAEAARFLQSFRDILSSPLELLVPTHWSS